MQFEQQLWTFLDIRTGICVKGPHCIWVDKFDPRHWQGHLDGRNDGINRVDHVWKGNDACADCFGAGM